MNHSRSEYVRADAHTNSVESVWSLLKRAVYGTWHDVSAMHLAWYVNGVSSQLNQGNCGIDMVDWIRALFAAMGGRQLRLRDLVADDGPALGAVEQLMLE